MGKRNREIACECFDIRIWQARWDVVLRQFGVSTAAIPGWKPKDSPKLVAMMPVKNESDRYLERVLENTLTFAEEIAILDDHSDPDQYAKLLDIQNKLGCDKIHVAQATATWDNESELRAELLRFALTRSPDWLIAVDADELYEPDMAGVVKEYMTQQSIDVVAFRFYDMWNDEYHYRDDDFFPAATVYAPRMFRVKNGTEYHFNGKLKHCGSIPQNIVDDVFLPSSIRVKHLGYMNPQDRTRKYREKTQDDPTYQYYSKEIYDAILDNDPPCVEWSDQNYWQAGAGKLVIAYPPDMHWQIMKQRPHHLLSLAASERHRVFFADDMAPADTIDAEPYLTLVKNWQDCEFVKDVDVLYVTAPHQLAYCGHINYKTIVYDCVDFQGSGDEELIRTADHVLCASQMLYDRALRLGARGPVYVPNACDYAHFASTLSPQNDVVGYMGIVASVLNLDIIKELAKRWPMFMMGEIKTDVSILKGKVDIRGHVPYDALPQNLASAKVGIIPFKIGGDYEMYSAPIKVYEYLAAGRPVVATPIPELLPLAEQGLIRVAEEDDIDGWMQAVGEAMKEYPNAAGQEWAKTQTWINRWETIKAEVLNI